MNQLLLSYLQKPLSQIEKLDLFSKDNNQRLPIIGITAATCLLLYTTYKVAWSSDRVLKQGTRQIPEHSSSYPYVGHLFSLGDLPGLTMANWHKELGPIIRVRMGKQNWISVSDPIFAHKLFVTHGNSTSYRPFMTFGHKYHGQNGKGIIFSNPGEGFKESRAAASNILSANQLAKQRDVIEKEADDLLERAINDTLKNGCTDAGSILHLSSLNVIMNIGFGKRYLSVEDPEFIELNEIVRIGIILASPEKDISTLLPALYFIDMLSGYKKQMESLITDRRDPLYNKLISEAWASEKPSFAKSLKEENANLGRTEIMVIMNDLLNAGTDTASTTLYWIIALMCNYPEIQAKAREELDNFIREHGRVPHYEERKKTPYSYCVIRETLRYRSPSTFGIPHETREEIVVDGYVIPAGSVLVSNIYGMNFNPDFYDEPDRFMPERFMKYETSMTAAANGKISERDHYSFGWGRRTCPGIQLADIEIYNAFVRLYSSCIIELYDEIPDVHKMNDQGGLLLLDSYKVKFIKRNNQ